jgi:chromosome partitioning protein
VFPLETLAIFCFESQKTSRQKQATVVRLPMKSPSNHHKGTTMLKISITARKGGQARSTSAVHMAGAFSKLGYRVLVIDGDAQPTTSKFFLSPTTVDSLPPERTTVALYEVTGKPSTHLLVHPTAFPNISLIPGSDHATRFDHPVPEAHPFLCDAIRDFLHDENHLADIVLMDTAPSSALLTYSTLVAADFAITPVECRTNAVQELQFVQDFIGKVTTTRNSSLRWMGLFPSRYAKRHTVQRLYREDLERAFGDLFIPIAIPESSIVEQAFIQRKLLPTWKPRTAVARAYIELADEILKRAGQLAPAQRSAA